MTYTAAFLGQVTLVKEVLVSFSFCKGKKKINGISYVFSFIIAGFGVLVLTVSVGHHVIVLSMKQQNVAKSIAPYLSSMYMSKSGFTHIV